MSLLNRMVGLLFIFFLSTFNFKAQLYGTDTEINYTTIHNIISVNNKAYATGFYRTPSSSISIACYWEGNKLHELTNENGEISQSEAIAISVDNKDNYVLGKLWQNDSTFTYACWKNGKWLKKITFNLNELRSEEFNPEANNRALTPNSVLKSLKYNYIPSLSDLKIKGFAVNKGDIYIIANIEYQGICWKNETRLPLEELPYNKDITNHFSSVNTLFIHDDNVYIAGDSEGKPVYWKNGKCYALPVPDYPDHGTLRSGGGKALDITVDHTDVYLSGYYINRGILPCYWKNQQRIELSSPHIPSKATCIKMTTNGLYVGGYLKKHNGNVVCYWKDGNLIAAPDSASINITALKFLTDSANNIALLRGYALPEYDYGYGDIAYKDLYSISEGKIRPLPLEQKTSKSYLLAGVKKVVVSEKDVYAMGYYKAAGHNTMVPVVWKNGVRQSLPVPPEAYNITAFDIVTEKNDLLVLGRYEKAHLHSQGYYYCYWRNGKLTVLDSLQGIVAAEIVNGKMYTISYKVSKKERTYTGIYSVNNKAYHLSLPGQAANESAYPAALDIDPQGNVIITGSVYQDDKQVAAVWKNNKIKLISAPKDRGYEGQQIKRTDGKLTILGSYNNYQKDSVLTGGFSWTEGKNIELYPLNKYGWTEFFFVDQTQQYSLHRGGKLLKNDQDIHLEATSNRLSTSGIDYLTIYDGKTYVGRYYVDGDGNQKACYWVDGKLVTLD